MHREGVGLWSCPAMKKQDQLWKACREQASSESLSLVNSCQPDWSEVVMSSTCPGLSFNALVVCYYMLPFSSHWNPSLGPGFLDGSDRVMALEAHPDPPSHLTPINIAQSDALEYCHLQPELPTPILLVKNLPKLLFASVSDLEPLLRPFGSVSIIDLRTDPASDGSSCTAIVKFHSFEDAQEAKTCLDGQVYAGFTLKLERMLSPTTSQSSSMPFWAPTRNSTPLARSCSKSKHLNPLAAPFSREQPRGPLVTLSSYGAVSNNASSSLTFDPYLPQLHHCNYSSSYVPPHQNCYDLPLNHALNAPVLSNTLDPVMSSGQATSF